MQRLLSALEVGYEDLFFWLPLDIKTVCIFFVGVIVLLGVKRVFFS